MGDELEKRITSFLVAFFAPWAIALVLNLYMQNVIFLLVTGLLLSIWTLGGGFQKNSELENSIGGLFGSMTDWIIPSGISWWVPKPFGEALQRTSIGKLELDHTRTSGKQATMVETSDGTQVEVSYYCLFRIVNLRIWSSVQDPKKTLDAMMDRSVRWFVSEWPVEGITKIKDPFSHYLMGKVTKGPDGNDLVSGISEALLNDLGVEMISARVDDVNPPKSIVEANEALAREDTEDKREKKNTASRIKRALEIKAALPTIDDQAALDAALAMTGDIEVIKVLGDGGDFTKGAAVQRSPRKMRKPT